ncbi:hypothetical protein BDK51DRAFT_28472 [Blyttiomyces helicus]|uniref:Regulator of G protein signaling domain-containing protein n=1 Tax=Blyttiomyces helicus TaxID=388810 RepID=A0A4P9WFI5_9FUNG|nr:hypothetical protein BDK51DRAFT_28472 [Blyttiomyces helicus]|eukprot:RKO91521.1 hypothetical protein BDK51DRAFT_28472 [Blyttiomyces helicus]
MASVVPIAIIAPVPTRPSRQSSAVEDQSLHLDLDTPDIPNSLATIGDSYVLTTSSSAHGTSQLRRPIRGIDRFDTESNASDSTSDNRDSTASTVAPIPKLPVPKAFAKLAVDKRLSMYQSHISRLMPKQMEQVASLESRPATTYARKIAMLEKLVSRMQDPSSGLEIKDRRKMFKVYPESFIASDLVDWFMAACDFMVREEGMRMGQMMLDEGYIIAVDLGDRFISDGSFYVIQTSYYWASQSWHPSELDYAVYLVKRSMRNTVKYALTFYEEERLDRLQSILFERWSDVLAIVQEHETHAQRMSKSDRRLFHLHEYSFWKIHRPYISPNAPFAEDDRANRQAPLTQSQYEKRMSPEELLVWMEKKLENLVLSSNMNRTRPSRAAKNIIARCDLFAALDPMLETSYQPLNPWITDETFTWDSPRSHPTPAVIRVWTSSFFDMLQDPMGISFFYEFLKKEFSQENLEFYLKCVSLDTISTRSDFTKQAQAIYTDFIPTGSPRELNIVSSLRASTVAHFEKLATAPKSLPYSCFDEVVRATLTLLAKDSYVRFCNSEFLSDALRAAMTRELAMRGDLGVPAGSASDLAGGSVRKVLTVRAASRDQLVRDSV